MGRPKRAEAGVSFWTEAGSYGVVHRAADQGPRPGRGVLVVFVHGIFGDCRRTWGRMPEWVLGSGDADVVSFSYPAQLWERTSIAQAADDLKTWLETQFVDHRYLLFVTHSTGGLIVKYMLHEAYAAIERRVAGDGPDLSATASVWLRTRWVINIAVPHSGGSRRLTGLARALYRGLLYPLWAPILTGVRFLSQGGKDWGKNDILPALRWQNPWLLALEADFMRQLCEAEALELPAPVVHDIYAKSDLSVPFEANPSARNLYFRGTHGSVKVPKHPSAPVVGIVSRFVSRYAQDRALEYVDRMLLRIDEVNRVMGVQALLGREGEPDPDADRVLPQMQGVWGGTQHRVCDVVLKKVFGGRERSRSLVITGTAGVGKSVVTRMVAWRLGRVYLSNPGGETPLPLLIPLQQVTLSKVEALGVDLWEALWAWWLQWVRSLYPDAGSGRDWLEHAFRMRTTTVILDGLDDFLVNHPALGLSSLVDMLRQVGARYGDNRNLTIVVAIRSGFHGLERLAGDPRDVHEVLRLTVAQAQSAFPACRSWLPCVRDPGLLELVLTPLILSNYEPEVNCLIDDRALTAAMIMDQAIRTILRRSHLVGVRQVDGQIAEVDPLLHALSLIAWLFFSKHRGELDAGVLVAEAGVAHARWEAHFRERDALAEGCEVLAGFRQLAHAAMCMPIVQHTVFVSTGPNRVRFGHRSWQEYLLAKYFVQCLRWGFVEDFGVTAFNSHIYRMAGECFAGETISESRVQAVLAAWERSRNTYITGNLIAFLAWTRTGIEPQALQLLLNELERFEALSRVVLIAGLGYRVLVNDPADPSLYDIRRALFPKLCEFADPATTPVDDPVARSLAWCYQKAFAESFGMPQPRVPWPEIGFSDEETVKALPMICTVEGDRWRLDTRSRSLQLAFLVPILDAYHDAKLAIRALHYLYYLVVARKHGVHVLELSQELPQLLAPGCRFEQVIASFTMVPEVQRLYHACQVLHERLQAAFL